MFFILARGALCAAVLMPLSGPAAAHAVLEPGEARAGAPYRGAIQIAHGCQGSPTTAVRVTIPEGAVAARPKAKAGWTIKTKTGPYARPYPAGHGTLSEGVKEITWSGARLPNDQFDEFVFTVRLSDAFKPGEVVHFPVDQICETGAAHWTEIPGGGQDANALKRPAPRLRVVAAEGAAEMAPGPKAVKAGDLLIEQPWMRATPGGAKVAGGYVRISNGGSASDRLLGASIPLAARGEVHEMSNEGGVMKMRPVEGGLEIRPGQAVELKPGGYHLMFMDLSGGAKEGDSVRGTLVFEKAGTVEVDFAVAGIGARGPAGGQGHH